MRDAEWLPDRRTHPEAQFWSYVELATDSPWFSVIVMQKNEKRLHQSFIFAPTVQLLQGLLKSSTAKVWIDAVYINSRNGAGGWRMDSLLELSEFRNDNDQIVGYRYMVSDGEDYSTATIDGPDTGHSVGLIFSAQKHLGPK
jgi:hypothetical protein